MARVGDPPGSPETLYQTRVEAFGADATWLSLRFNRLANLRLVAFVATAACLVWGVGGDMPLAIGLAGVLGAVFVFLVRHHRHVGVRRNRAAALRNINAEALDRLARQWDRIPLRHTVSADRLHPYAADLDLFGHASLLHLLDTTRTSIGQATLTRWLTHAASTDTLHARQVAMAELVPELDLRQGLEVSAGPEGTPRPDPESLLTWAESEPPLLRRGVWRWVARINPVLLCALGLAQATGLVSWPVWLPFLFVNVVVWQVFGTSAYARLSRIGSLEPALRQYAAGLDLVSTATFDAPLLRELLLRLHANGRSAAAHIRTLERLARLVIPRSALAYWVVQMIVLWDVQVLAALEDWQTTAGPRARVWLETFGEIEALAALAALSHAHPDWAIPQIDASAPRLEAQQAGHPLLPPRSRVDNDVTLGPAGTFVLVTGSNMAGKSTYLRTIGTNIVLAQAGGPVCARMFRMPPLDLCTSMRVVDSLERGVSTFLAEVVRLKQVVDVARQADAERSVCYLLDEVLQGTNSAERQIAVRQVIRFLLARRAIGAVSTHDLALADLPEFAAAAQHVHFQETLTAAPEGPVMTFDYRLEPGPATSTNALRLMAILGLDEASL